MRQLTAFGAIFDVSADNDEAKSAIDLRGFKLVAIQVPSTWDDAAAVAFYSCARSGPRGRNPATADYALALALEVTADTYRVLTAAEQAMARGLCFVRVLSLEAASMPDPFAQTLDSELVLVVEPRE